MFCGGYGPKKLSEFFGSFGYHSSMPKAKNKTIETDASVDEFLDALTDEQQRDDSRAIVEMMRKATGKEPKMWGTAIIGFGSEHIRYESGRELDQPKTAFSPRKNSISLYLTCDAASLSDTLAKLGKYKTGKGCIYIKRLADVDRKVLEKIITTALKRS